MMWVRVVKPVKPFDFSDRGDTGPNRSRGAFKRHSFLFLARGALLSVTMILGVEGNVMDFDEFVEMHLDGLDNSTCCAF